MGDRLGIPGAVSIFFFSTRAFQTTHNKHVDVPRLTLPFHTLFMDRERRPRGRSSPEGGVKWRALRVKEASESCSAAEQEGHRRAGHQGDQSHKQPVGRRVCINSGFLTKRTSLSPFIKDFRGGERSRVQSIFGGLCCLAEPCNFVKEEMHYIYIYCIYMYTHIHTHTHTLTIKDRDTSPCVLRN